MRRPFNGFRALLKRAGIDNFRIHDLRRTLASWQLALGTNLAVIQKTLGHADISTTMIYARLSLDPVRASMEEAARALRAAGEKTEGAEIVQHPKGRG
jgi:integrase